MKPTKNCLSKYYTKRILVPLLLAAIVLEMGVLLSWQTPSFNLASMDTILLRQGTDTLIILSQYQETDTTHWETYRSEELGFEIKYPQNWASDIEKGISLEDGGVVAKKKYIFSSDVLSFSIAVNENSAETFYFDKLLGKSLRDNLSGGKFAYALEENGVVYAIHEYFSISGFSGVIFYTNRKGNPPPWPIMGEAMLKRGKTIFHFRLSVEQEALLEKNKDIFKQILSTFRFTNSITKLKIFAAGPLEPSQECLDKPDGYKKWSCFRPYFETLTNEVSASASMAEAIKFEEQRIVSDCHLFAHYVGETNLEKYNFNMGKAFSSCTPGCLNGCFHGVMERYIRYETEPDNVISKIKNMCDSVGTDWAQKRRCFHGVGHGLLAHNYLPLLDALGACKTLGSDRLDDWGIACIGGLLMENMDQYLELDLDEDNFRKIIPEICAPFESMELELRICIEQIALGALYYTGYNIEHSEKLCEELIQQKYIDLCREDLRTVILIEKPSNIDIWKFFENHEGL